MDQFQRRTIAEIIAMWTYSHPERAELAIEAIEQAGFEIRRKRTHADIQFGDVRSPVFDLGEK